MKLGNESPRPRTSESAGAASFVTTHWSDVVAARASQTPQGEEALADLCRRYWYPLYAYVRGCGFSQEDSEDLIQAFFVHLLEGDLLVRADPARGRFRWFLLRSLQNFLRNELVRDKALKRGGGFQRISLDSVEAEREYIVEPADSRTPDEMFDLRWAQATVGHALRRLAEEFAGSGRTLLFEHLKLGLVDGRTGTSYEEMARQLGITVSAVKVAMHRLRQRYRDLVRAEIGCVVADPAQVELEFRHLIELLAS